MTSSAGRCVLLFRRLDTRGYVGEMLTVAVSGARASALGPQASECVPKPFLHARHGQEAFAAGAVTSVPESSAISAAAVPCRGRPIPTRTRPRELLDLARIVESGAWPRAPHAAHALCVAPIFPGRSLLRASVPAPSAKRPAPACRVNTSSRIPISGAIALALTRRK